MVLKLTLIGLPLFLLFFCSILTLSGFEGLAFNPQLTYSMSLSTYGLNEFNGVWDENGHQILDENFTAVGETGSLSTIEWYQNGTFYYVWTNSTSAAHYIYHTYLDDDAELPFISMVEDEMDFDDNGYVDTTLAVNFADLSGITLFIAGVITIVTVAGLRILGNGMSDISLKVIFVCVTLGSLWGIFSAMGYGVLLLIPTFGTLIYFALSMIYVIGIIYTVAE